MKRYEHLSGAEKRKRKAQKQEAQDTLLKKHPKIVSFFNRVQDDVPSTSTHQETDSSDTQQNDTIIIMDKDVACDIPKEISEIVSKNNQSPHTNITNNDLIAISSVNKTVVSHDHVDNLVGVGDYPTDRGNFGNVLSDELKHFIISNGPCKPRGPFPKDENQHNRSFSCTYYEKFTKAGFKIKREWLCYSIIKDAVYCEACWLFSERKGSLLSPWADEGIRDWQGLSRKIDSHEKSATHLKSCRILDVWRNERTVDAGMQSEIKKETNKWVSVLERIVNVTLTLAGSNLAFRGHRENIIGEPNGGNFLALIDLLSKYDPVLKEILSGPKYSNKYMSPAIQNELIQLLSNTVKGTISQEIESAQFFSIIMDTTQDQTKTDQLSQVVRYVSILKDEAERPTSLVVNERFLGFREITDQTGEALEEEIIKSLEEKQLKLSKCRGQGYDGAANMSGVYNGVKSRIERKQKTAKYVHCAAHNLNLVLNDACSKIQENKNFF